MCIAGHTELKLNLVGLSTTILFVGSAIIPQAPVAPVVQQCQYIQYSRCNSATTRYAKLGGMFAKCAEAGHCHGIAFFWFLSLSKSGGSHKH